jgi:hypothetical protein
MALGGGTGPGWGGKRGTQASEWMAGRPRQPKLGGDAATGWGGAAGNRINAWTAGNPMKPGDAAQSGAAPDPGGGQRLRDTTTPTQGAQAPAQSSPYGTESGPGILESWFNQRAAGTDPAFEYAAKRGMETLGNRYSAAGAFNSGAARQGESDLMANLVAQRMGQLDSLAGGASGEHMGRLSQMFNQGMGIAGGQAGLSSAYDLGAAGNMQAANQAQQQMALNKAGVDAKANQGLINTGLQLYGLSQMGGNRTNPYGGY